MSSEKFVRLSIIELNGKYKYMDSNGIEYIKMSDNNGFNSFINNDVSIEMAIVYIAISLALITLGGITSGLNVSLLSIDQKKLKILGSNKDTKIQEMITKIKPIIKDHHLLLTTLLVSNAICMEALPIFLNKLVISWLAIIVSVTFVLLFGEIIPQALFTSNPLLFGFKMRHLLRVFMLLLYPICKPISLLLDVFFGKKHLKNVIFTQNELKTILSDINLHKDQKLMLNSLLKLHDLTVNKSMIEWENITQLNCNIKLDINGLMTIYETGYSRIPIYEYYEHNIIGLLLVKTLIPVDPNPNLTIKTHLQTYSNNNILKKPLVVNRDMDLIECINLFQETRTHFALVSDTNNISKLQQLWDNNKIIPKIDKNIFCGIVTLEDIIEEIVCEEVYDEFDGVRSPSKLSFVSQKNNLSSYGMDAHFSNCVYSRFSRMNQRIQRIKFRNNNNNNNIKSSDDEYKSNPLIMDETHKLIDPLKQYGTFVNSDGNIQIPK